MMNQIIKLTKELISFNSSPDNKNELLKILNFSVNQLRKFKRKEFSKNSYKSVLIYNTNSFPKKFKIILNAHLDVIPGKKENLKFKILNNKLYGLGSLDMKAAAAVEILVFKEIAKKLNYPIALQLVTDEEIGGFNGTKHQIDKGVRAEFVIVGEPTGLDIENKAKGIIWVEIEFFGKSAHSAYPWKGENTLVQMSNFIYNLNKKINNLNKNLYQTTFNIASIETNNFAFNKIPDYCKLKLDIRYIPEEKKILNKIKKLLPNTVKLNILLNEPPFYTEENNFYLKKLKEIDEKRLRRKIEIKGGHGSSDIRHYARINVKGIEFGPYGEGMGSNNEWVSIKSLENFYLVLKDFLLSLNRYGRKISKSPLK